MNSLKEALDIHPKDVISIVGAGGKTTLMFALSRELTMHEKVVITTTTTKIFPPSSFDTPYLLISQEENEMVDFTLKKAGALGHITIASKMLAGSGKLQGISPLLISRLITLSPVNYIIIEADGASKRPLKAPNPEYEPVLPLCTTLVIPMVGIDALGCELSEKKVFRSEIASRLTGIPLGGTVSADAIVNLMLHPSGMTRGSPADARIIPFINKMDLNADRSMGRDIGFKILKANHPQVDRVVLSQVRLHPPVTEVVFKKE
jgi:probable selenium-dependent hydroxylase accessory protein YqeC